MKHYKAFCLLLLVICFFSCSENTENQETTMMPDIQEDEDPPNLSKQERDALHDDFFDLDRIHIIEVEMSEEDWDEMRYQRRTTISVFGGENCYLPVPHAYDYFPGNVTINGERFEGAGIRKKGLVGSFSLVRPSLKIRLDRWDDSDQSYYSGVKRLTLNNNKQDPAVIRQCLSYWYFKKAGITVPRCNFAQVFVNGVDKGIFTNVEPIKKPFLRHNFGDDSGDLYEGTFADFIDDPIWQVKMEKKNDENDGSHYRKLTSALELNGKEMVQKVSEVLNLDNFITFWAMETLAGHWDGYTGNTNNFLFYVNPEDSLIYFIPWGTDGTFTPHRWHSLGAPWRVYTNGHLASRLYQNADTRKMYYDKMNYLLENIYNPKELNNMAEKMISLVSPHIGSHDREFFEDGIKDVLDFAEKIAEKIEIEMETMTPQPIHGYHNPPCKEEAGFIRGRVTTKMGTFPSDNPFETGRGNTSIKNDEIDIQDMYSGASAGVPPEAGKENYTMLVIAALENVLDPENSNIHIIYLTFENIYVEKGKNLDLLKTESYHLLIPAGGGEATLKGFLEMGTIEFIEASMEKDSPLVVDFDIKLFL